VDKLTLAALEATLRGPGVPIRQALHTDPAVLRDRASALADKLAGAGLDARAVPSEARVGGGGAPGVTLPSAAVSLPERLAVPLRTGEPPIVGRMEGGRLLLDLRTVPEDRDDTIARAVLEVSRG
jgi:L-seryl-tRNA(Ser) seleniumtransferase